MSIYMEACRDVICALRLLCVGQLSHVRRSGAGRQTECVSGNTRARAIERTVESESRIRSERERGARLYADVTGNAQEREPNSGCGLFACCKVHAMYTKV